MYSLFGVYPVDPSHVIASVLVAYFAFHRSDMPPTARGHSAYRSPNHDHAAAGISGPAGGGCAYPVPVPQDRRHSVRSSAMDGANERCGVPD